MNQARACVDIRLAPGAEENGLANMLAQLVRENIEAKPHKKVDFDALSGSIAIVADDACVALTMRFERGGKLTIHDGIVGVPDVTIRGAGEVIMALSNMPLATRLALPIPDPRDPQAVSVVRDVVRALRKGELHFHGMLFHPGLLMKLSHIMSVNG
ncbi:MAG: hypothetical protein ABTD50_15960 [Polyangiaceae bacterium]|jgi:hypothetical protein